MNRRKRELDIRNGKPVPQLPRIKHVNHYKAHGIPGVPKIYDAVPRNALLGNFGDDSTSEESLVE